MRETREFHYRVPGRVRGHRPGSHAGLSRGAGQEFVSHVSLYERPDPRRLDLRASLRSLRGEWLVRVNRQRAGLSVYAILDVSGSMRFGAASMRGASKLHVAGDFLESLGLSAFRAGDALGMLAFDSRECSELFVPPRIGRGIGAVLRERLNRFIAAQTGEGARASSAGALELAAMRLAGREGLVFVVSDFHWPLERLNAALDLLSSCTVVPLIVWNPAEIEPPAANGFALLRDSESGAQRTLWLRPRLRTRWREAVSERRQELQRIFAEHFVRPLYMEGAFDAESVSKYFLEDFA